MKKKLVMVLAAIMLTGVIGGCGTKDVSTTGPDKSNANVGDSSQEKPKEKNAQGVTDDSILVANSIATSGAFAPVGVPFKVGIEAYFKMVNDGNGIGGRQIKYIHQDDEFNPEKGMAALDKFVNDDKVFAIVGHFGTPIVGATLNELKEIGIPAVYFATGTGILYNERATDGNGRNLFPVQPVYPMEGRIMVARVKGNMGASKVGVIYTNDDAGKDLLYGIEQEAKIQGIEVVAEQVAPLAEDVSSAVTRMNNENVDAVIIAAIQGTFPQIAKQLAEQGNTKPTLTTYVNADIAMVNAIKDDVGNKYEVYANAWVDVSKPDFALFQEWIQKASSEDYSFNAYAMTGWMAAAFFVEGLERVEGALTWENYIQALESSPVENPLGGMIDYSEGKRLGTQQMSMVKMDPEASIGWVEAAPIQGINEIIK